MVSFDNTKRTPPESGGQALAYAIMAGAFLIFCGLALVAFSVLQSSPAALSQVLIDRPLHYVLMAGIVVAYVYLQRR